MPKRSHDIPEDYIAYEQALTHAMGARIRHCRERLDLTQEQLRARIELEQVFISRSRYSRIEKGDTILHASELLALIRILDVSCMWLLLGDDQR